MDSEREERLPIVKTIVDKIKLEGTFDQLRKDCLADVDTKPAYLNLLQKVETACSRFLSKIPWSTSLNKNQLRTQLRDTLNDSGILQAGVKRIVNQVVTPRIETEIKPKVSQAVCEVLGLNADDLNSQDESRDDGEGPSVGVDVSQPPPPINLYPFNPFEPPPPLEAPPPLPPGFDDQPPVPAPPLPEDMEEDSPSENSRPGSRQSGDMDISSNSSSSRQKREDMDCTVTSDEENGGDEQGDDLTKGLAAYMAGDERKPDEGDDMSISSESNLTGKDSRTSSRLGPSPVPESTVTGQEVQTPSGSASDVAEKKPQRSASDVSDMVMSSRPRRHRTRNKKYMSEDFESIFTANRELLGDTYSDSVCVEEIITTDVMNEQVVSDEMIADEVSPPEVSAAPELLETEETESRSDSVCSKESSGHGQKEAPRVSSQRYDDSDLYKPRRSTRRRTRGATPPEEEKTPRVVTVKVTPPIKTMETLPSPGITSTARSGKTISVSVDDRNKDNDGQQEPISFSSLADQEGAHLLFDKLSAQATFHTTETASNEVLPENPPPACFEGSAPSGGSTPVQDEPAHDELLMSPVAPRYEPGAVTPTRDEPFCDSDDGPVAPAFEPGAVTPSHEGDTTPLRDELDDNWFAEQPANTSPGSFIPEQEISTESDPYETTSVVARPVEPVPEHINPSELPPEPGQGLEKPPPPKPVETAFDDGANTVTHDGTIERSSALQPETVYEPPESTEIGEISEGHKKKNQPQTDGASRSSGSAPPPEENDSDLEELEQLKKRKLEILKSIEMPESTRERRPEIVTSSEEEGEITDSEDEIIKVKKTKGKKSKRKKNKKDSKKRKHRSDGPNSSKRSRLY